MNYEEHKEGKHIVRTYASGSKEWLLNGLEHREDGPAIEYADGSKVWFLDGDIVYCDNANNLKNYPDLTEEFKKSIILYELRRN